MDVISQGQVALQAVHTAPAGGLLLFAWVTKLQHDAAPVPHGAFAVALLKGDGSMTAQDAAQSFGPPAASLDAGDAQLLLYGVAHATPCPVLQNN